MTETFYIKRGDTSPAVWYVLGPSSVSLAGATARFQMRSRGGPLVLDAPAVVRVQTGTPTLGYEWSAGDTEEAGQFEAEFRVVYTDGAIETFPNNGFLIVRIAEDVR